MSLLSVEITILELQTWLIMYWYRCKSNTVASYQENIELARKKVKILILSIIFCDIHIQFNGYRLLLKYRKGENFRCICFVVYFFMVLTYLILLLFRRVDWLPLWWWRAIGEIDLQGIDLHLISSYLDVYIVAGFFVLASKESPTDISRASFMFGYG